MSKHTKIENPFPVGTKDYYDFVRKQLGSGHPDYGQVDFAQSHSDSSEFAQIDIYALRERGPKVKVKELSK